jgi:hypothetical protein
MINYKINFRKEHFFYLFLYGTLLVGFFLGENSTGGAEYDSQIAFRAVKAFSLNLISTFKNYNAYEISHYPFYYIFLSQILKFSESIFVTKFIVFHLNLFLPFIFYKIIKFLYGIKNKYLIYLPGIIFLSPSFRASSIWGLNDNIALTFFSLSILFYLKFTNAKSSKKKLLYLIMNALMLSIAAYIRQYYAVFSLYFFYKFLQTRNIKIITFYIIANLLFASYAIMATIFKTNLNYSSNFITNNYANNIAFSITIFVIYLIPFYCTKDNFLGLIKYYQKYKKKILLNTIFVTIIYIGFNYSLPYGGGVIYKIIYNYNNYLYFFILFLSLIILTNFLSDNYKNNIVLILCIFLAFPLYAIYQKYFDPLSIILIFSLFKNFIIQKFINNLKYEIKFLYYYFFVIYGGSIFYSLALS